ncbi:MAG: UbiA prenyltransferase family protein [Acidobacteriota bacterium]|nr:UbiA prenyltransferase family protein [Acidobacteriota bacterium]
MSFLANDAAVYQHVKPTPAERLKAHLQIMRLDHSIKNIFVIPGIIVPLSILRTPLLSPTLDRNIGIGFLATTLIACSNYVLNEVLDAPFDRLHPKKMNRPAAQGLVNVPLAYVQWVAMMVAGIALALLVSKAFACTAFALWVMGCVYNISPFRTKDKMYLDVLSESVNNPLRMLLGWFMVTAVLVPPASLLICYWMTGCYLMALKRFSEFREIGDAQIAGAYRRSFRYYNEVSLLSSVTFYAAAAMLFFGAFIIRYRIELVLVFPLVALLMSTYFKLAFEANSAVQNPEKLYREPMLMAQAGLVSVGMIVLLYVNIPAIGRMFMPTLPSALGH